MRERKIVIVGGGVIGCCTAYYLTQHPSYDPEVHSITLIEAITIASGASGKAGGCLAPWADPACLAPASFQLHADLAAKYDGAANYGYRRVDSADCDAVKPHEDVNDGPAADDVDWIEKERLKWYKPMGITAQVDPRLFTQMVAGQARQHGVQMGFGTVSHITSIDGGHVVQCSDQPSIPATDVIVAAGPWTGTILPELPIRGEKSHSIVLSTLDDISPNILFFEPGRIDDTEDNNLEIYPRPNNTVYACGQTDYGLPLPASTKAVTVDKSRCEKIRQTLLSIAPILEDGFLTTEQACFRPLVDVAGRDPELGPLLGFVGSRSLIVAAGHNQWGIQNAPITGKVISEMIFEGRAISADISELDPAPYVGKDDRDTA